MGWHWMDKLREEKAGGRCALGIFYMPGTMPDPYLTPKTALLEAYFMVEETTDQGLSNLPKGHTESGRPEIQSQLILTPKFHIPSSKSIESLQSV